MKTLFLIFLFLFVFDNCHAQYYANYNKVWAFGYKAGLDFNSGSPVPISTGLAFSLTTEGCASVCDSFGHLLFYSNGMDVYNRNHAVMPGGSSITTFSTSSTTQAALILPVIGNPGKYYLFSLQQFTVGDAAMCRLVYCVVDMALAGGYGDVVASTKGTPVADSLGEKMMAVTGNNHNIWLLVHARDTALFLAYEITGSGISTVPIVSATGTLSSPYGYIFGAIKASPNRRKIVSQSVDQSASSAASKFGTELYDFDHGTGVVSNCIVIDSLHSNYSAEFSPDNTVLYTSEIKIDTTKIFQYNIAAVSSAAIRASRTQIAMLPKIQATDLKLGPDKKIYFMAADTLVLPGYSRYMDCITKPNLLGSSCGYVYRAVTLSPGTGVEYGLPNVYVTQDTNYVPTAISAVSEVQGLIVFPNPAANMLTISATEKIKHISIYTIAGQEVMNNEYNSEMIKVDISSLPSNLYFLKVNGIAVRQFVKQ